MGILRVTIDNDFRRTGEFAIPSSNNPEHNQQVFTARKRGRQFVDIAIIEGRCDFSHPAMAEMLRRIEDPEEDDVLKIVRQSVKSLRSAYASAVTG
ncbi:MAG: hypothetical protein PHX93_01335 [Candidatus Peribacteraceae bacterium]|jgi:hypothetical protein|nr:hypothetical protein [Candidatus Peribacteraceae bacterium]